MGALDLDRKGDLPVERRRGSVLSPHGLRMGEGGPTPPGPKTHAEHDTSGVMGSLPSLRTGSSSVTIYWLASNSLLTKRSNGSACARKSTSWTC
jgi:hypothetical protein